MHNLKHPQTLALIGLIQPNGPLLPVSEMQSRWFALLNAGKLQLPSLSNMEKDIQRKENELAWRYYESERHTIEADWLPFMNELAKEIGVYPPIWRYLFTDPKLFLTLIFGPGASYQYRLIGPNSWPGAREAMLTVHNRMTAPLHTNATKGQPTPKSGSLAKTLFIWLSISSLAYYTLINPSPTLSNYWSNFTQPVPTFQLGFLQKLKLPF